MASPEPGRSWVGEDILFRQLVSSREEKSPDLGADPALGLARLDAHTQDEGEDHDVLLNVGRQVWNKYAE